MSQADELAKLDANVEAAVVKVADVLRSVVGEENAEGHKTVNDSGFFLNLFWGTEVGRGGEWLIMVMGRAGGGLLAGILVE